MKLIAKKCFPKAIQVTDRLHLQKLALEAVQEIRITIKWEALDRENEAITHEKINKTKFITKDFTNGDTAQKLLTRSSFFLYKSLNKWSGSQKERAVILFKEYPELKEAYLISQQLRNIYNNNTDKAVAITKLAHWYNNMKNLRIKSFTTIMITNKVNHDSILHYFDNRSTNA
jgi:transposase